jgi:hypothetical protein
MCGNNSDKCYTVDLSITSDLIKMNNHLKGIVQFVMNVKIK